MINTYPDSELVARSKLAIADSWYAEGTASALTQAENEYNDFKTFFPNLPEAAEAQMKIGDIEYRQMQKSDRDCAHAKRAQEDYRTMIREFPDSKLIPQAKQKLREVQELLADREFDIGHFYYLRNAYPAAIARFQSLVDTYPLYNGASESLLLLGDSYEKQGAMVHGNAKLTEEQKKRLLADYQTHEAESYSRIITRYPATPPAEEAAKRLQALHLPVPKPTPEAIAQNRAEIAGKRHVSMKGKITGDLHRRPDTSLAAKVGEPTMVDPKPTGAPEVVRESSELIAGKPAGEGSHSVNVETVGAGDPGANQAAPHSDSSSSAAKDGNGISQLTPAPRRPVRPTIPPMPLRLRPRSNITRRTPLPVVRLPPRRPATRNRRPPRPTKARPRRRKAACIS